MICLVVDDSKPDEVDGVSVGINCDGTAEVLANVSRDIVEGPNSGQVYGLRECSGRTSPQCFADSANRPVLTSGRCSVRV